MIPLPTAASIDVGKGSGKVLLIKDIVLFVRRNNRGLCSMQQ